MKPRLTYYEATQMFRYVPETGELYWKRRGNKRNIFKPCGHFGRNSSNGGGYGRVWYDGYKYLIHRIIWLLNYGVWPTHQIDHIDGNKKNNRLENLRDVTELENTGSYFRKQNNADPR